jgi:hypothetical protein
MVTKILAIDLGKYKSVACNYVTTTGTARFTTVVTHVLELDRQRPKLRAHPLNLWPNRFASWPLSMKCCQKN